MDDTEAQESIQADGKERGLRSLLEGWLMSEPWSRRQATICDVARGAGIVDRQGPTAIDLRHQLRVLSDHLHHSLAIPVEDGEVDWEKDPHLL